MPPLIREVARRRRDGGIYADKSIMLPQHNLINYVNPSVSYADSSLKKGAVKLKGGVRFYFFGFFTLFNIAFILRICSLVNFPPSIEIIRFTVKP